MDRLLDILSLAVAIRQGACFGQKVRRRRRSKGGGREVAERCNSPCEYSTKGLRFASQGQKH